jgi:hypothetical protein
MDVPCRVLPGTAVVIVQAPATIFARQADHFQRTMIDCSTQRSAVSEEMSGARFPHYQRERDA